MDLHTIRNFHHPSFPEEVRDWQPGDAWLAGGTWLFSEPQPHLHTLYDIHNFQWPSLTPTNAGLEIASTCRIVELEAFTDQAPAEWTAAPLFRDCSRALLMSFKIWNEATVGGNLCMSLPAGAMISLTAALEGIVTLWPRDGTPRQISVVDFVTDNNRNVLQPGELLRSIWLPATALRKRYAIRRFALTQEGRSSILVIGTLCPQTGSLILTITASTPRPIQLHFAETPSSDALRDAIHSAIPDDGWFDDVHGSPAHRQHVTHYFAQQIRDELALPHA